MTQDEFISAVLARRVTHPLPNIVDELFDEWAVDDWARVCAMAAHTLQHEGAKEEEWKGWLALSAFGRVYAGDHWVARALGVIAGVYDQVADLLPRQVPVPKLADLHAFAYALGLVEAAPAVPDAERMALVGEGYDSLNADDYWGILGVAVREGDGVKAADALGHLKAWWEERQAGGDWDAELRPGYEPVLEAMRVLGEAGSYFPPRTK